MTDGDARGIVIVCLDPAAVRKELCPNGPIDE